VLEAAVAVHRPQSATGWPLRVLQANRKDGKRFLKEVVAKEVNGLLWWARVEIGFGWGRASFPLADGGSPGLGYVGQEPFASAVLQLAAAVARTYEIAVCALCGEVFGVKEGHRAPRSDRRNYCPAHTAREKARHSWKVSKRRLRGAGH